MSRKFRGGKMKAWSSRLSLLHWLARREKRQLKLELHAFSMKHKLKLELHAFSMKEALIQLTAFIQPIPSFIEKPIGPPTGRA
jgi:hypothetical protein